MNPKNETLRLQSAEKLFERIEKQVREKEKFEFLFYETAAHSFYTPPSNVAAWLHKHEIENPKGRDYEALTKAAKRKPVGYWEDAPRGAKFTQDSTCPKCGNMMVAGHHCTTGDAKCGDETLGESDADTLEAILAATAHLEPK